MMEQVKPVMRRCFVTLEDQLCINCTWDESEDLGNNGALPLNTEYLLIMMDESDYFNMKFLYNQYSYLVLPQIYCEEECGRSCCFKDDGSHNINDEVVPGQFVFEMYNQRLQTFHQEFNN